MAEPTIVDFRFKRRQTRTYDSQNNPERVLSSLLDVICPAGTLIPTLLASEPGDGWKLCNGQSLSKAEYPRLFAILGGTYGQTETTFQLPNLQGRAPFGAGALGGLMSVGGAASVVLSVQNLPPHSHAVTDPGHSHSFTPTEHSHGITDPGHTHTAAAVSAGTSEGGSDTASAVAGDTSVATTGITVDPAAAGGAVEPATTGISIGNTGSGQAVSIMPPFIAVNWMVRT